MIRTGTLVLPQSSKIFLIEHPESLKYGKMFGVSHRFKVCLGARYLGGFIEDDE